LAKRRIESNGVLPVHYVLRRLLRRHVLVPPAGLSDEAVHHGPDGPDPHGGTEDLHAEVVVEEREILEDENPCSKNQPVVPDEAFPFNLLEVKLADVAAFHAGTHAELVGIFFRNVEEDCQLWVMEFIVRGESELDSVAFLIRIAVFPHECQQLLGGDEDVALHNQAALRAIVECLEGISAILLVRDNFEVSNEERHLF
jgi:hypothetical protein